MSKPKLVSTLVLATILSAAASAGAQTTENCRVSYKNPSCTTNSVWSPGGSIRIRVTVSNRAATTGAAVQYSLWVKQRFQQDPKIRQVTTLKDEDYTFKTGYTHGNMYMKATLVPKGTSDSGFVVLGS
jgi:hypothetical protein